MADAVIHGKQYGDVSATIDKLAADAAIPQDQVRAALVEGWSQGAEQRCKAQPISPEEFEAIDSIWRAAGIKNEDIDFKTAGHYATIFSCKIWLVLHDQIQPYQGPVSFNLQPGEVLVDGMPNVLLKQQTKETSYVGGYSGVSIRVASGLYYRLGGLRGHRVESMSLQEVDYGDFLVTTRAIYFGGMARGLNFRVPLNQIIRFQPYSDAIGICRNGAREQIFVPLGAATPVGMAVANSADTSRFTIPPGTPQTFLKFPDCGWFLFNILQALAAKDSAAMGHHG
jgi:hypothetical protein